MPTLSYSAGVPYRYAFNGKEKDPEFQNNYDYGARIYNANIGRFLTVDPLTDDYPFFSPYLFGGNDVISASDVDGLEPSYKQVDGTYVFARDGYLQRPLRDQYAIKQILKQEAAKSYNNDEVGKKFADDATELLFLLTPFDELNTLITGENPQGEKVNSFQAILDLGMATTRGKKGGGAPMKAPKLKAPNYKTAKLNLPTKTTKGGVYSLKDPLTKKVVRTGRAKDLEVREKQHNQGKDTKGLDFETEYKTDNYAEQRGLEDIIYNKNPWGLPENGGLNKIRPISPKNPNKPIYQKAAKDFLNKNKKE